MELDSNYSMRSWLSGNELNNWEKEGEQRRLWNLWRARLSREVIIKKNINYIYWSERPKPQSGRENVSRGFTEVPVFGFLFYPWGTKVSRVVKKHVRVCLHKGHLREQPVCDMHVIVLTMLVSCLLIMWCCIKFVSWEFFLMIKLKTWQC